MTYFAPMSKPKPKERVVEVIWRPDFLHYEVWVDGRVVFTDWDKAKVETVVRQHTAPPPGRDNKSLERAVGLT